MHVLHSSSPQAKKTSDQKIIKKNANTKFFSPSVFARTFMNEIRTGIFCCLRLILLHQSSLFNNQFSLSIKTSCFLFVSHQQNCRFTLPSTSILIHYRIPALHSIYHRNYFLHRRLRKK